MIDLKDAETFLRLCETLNLTRTATLCKVSPSTLSRTLNKVEMDIGAKLCIRDKKGIQITPAGRKFEVFARQCIEGYHNLKNSLDTNVGKLTGTVKIYCSVTASYLFIPRILNEIRLSEPNLEIMIETGDPADALGHLNDKKTDFVISALPNEIPSNIQYVDLVSFPLILIAPKTPLFEGGYGNNIDNYTLSRVPFVMPEKGQLRYEVDKWLKSIEVTPNVYSEIAGHEAILSLTGLGLGISVVPRLVYEISPFKNDVVILKTLPWSNFRVALCSLKSKAEEEKIRAVTKLTKRLAPSFMPDLTRRRAENSI
ncbi:MAG TPA: HTH-type transcriptional activator IlvY [Succinivibrionaceae bacterium]|nr:HTH-type transcriptional activator IlvY [Succinivibrio sp.]HAR79327.1 HTH-type transcriptional activator IlvY [Succinivibrionaceae bacterium]